MFSYERSELENIGCPYCEQSKQQALLIVSKANNKLCLFFLKYILRQMYVNSFLPKNQC